jgi:hypothetical protein
MYEKRGDQWRAPEDHLTAADVLAEAIREHVRPFLKERGYRTYGSGFLSYAKEQDGNLLIVNFQKHRASNKQEIFMALNVGVSSGRLDHFLEPGRTWRILESHCHWRSRLGHLLPSNIDCWWEIRADGGWIGTPSTYALQRGQDLAGELISKLQDYALPALDAHASDEALIDYWLTRQGLGLRPRLLCLALLLGMTGRQEEFARAKDALTKEAQDDPRVLDALVKLRRWEESIEREQLVP